MQLGWIGLGHLGKAVAGRLLSCGHRLTVWNRTAARAEGLEAASAASPAAVAAAATEMVFLCLFDSEAVATVLSGPDGVLSGPVAGKVIVDLTTHDFRRVADFHRRCEAVGAAYLESPVLGSVVPASQGALTVLVSGGEAAYRRVEPVLQDIGRHFFYLGAPTLATRMKLINNLTLGVFMAALAEALAVGEAAGLDRRTVLDILSVGGGNSLVLNAKKDKLLNRDFAAHFSNALIYKDLQCLQALAYELRKPLPIGAAAKELYARTFEESFAEEDFSAVYKLLSKS